MKYKIYQHFTVESYHTNDKLQIVDGKYGLPLTFPERLFVVDKKYLSMTFEGEIFPPENTHRDTILEQLYSMFNMEDRPTGRYATSLSTGDVVMLNDEYFICASFGFEKVQARKYKVPSELILEDAIEMVIDEMLRLIEKKMNGYHTLNYAQINTAFGEIQDFEVLRYSDGVDNKIFFVGKVITPVGSVFKIVPNFRIEQQCRQTGHVTSKIYYDFTPEGVKDFMDELNCGNYKIVFYYSEEKDAIVCLSNNKFVFLQEGVSSTDLVPLLDGCNLFAMSIEETIHYIDSEITDGIYNGNSVEDNDVMLRKAKLKDYPITTIYSAFTLSKQLLYKLIKGIESEYIKSLF